MALISDILMVAGALGAGFYCFVLSRRLSAFKDAESGVGQVVSSLSMQVDELNRSIEAARVEAGASSSALSELTHRAETVAQRLELMVASMHDIPNDKNIRNRQDSPVFSTRMSEPVRQVNERT